MLSVPSHGLFHQLGMGMGDMLVVRAWLMIIAGSKGGRADCRDACLPAFEKRNEPRGQCWRYLTHRGLGGLVAFAGGLLRRERRNAETDRLLFLCPIGELLLFQSGVEISGRKHGKCSSEVLCRSTKPPPGVSVCRPPAP